MEEYRRKPCKVECIQYHQDVNAFIDVLVDFLHVDISEICVKVLTAKDGSINKNESPIVECETAIGVANIFLGDYITKSKKGEILVWERNLFEKIHKKEN